jgi:hypothetical protein
MWEVLTQAKDFNPLNWVTKSQDLAAFCFDDGCCPGAFHFLADFLLFVYLKGVRHEMLNFRIFHESRGS